jgi:cytochrome c-type biogenesis protein CcmE
MDRRRTKFLLLGVGIVISMVFIFAVGVSQPGGLAYYMTVSEFLAAPDSANVGFRVNGKVVEGSIDRLATGEDVTFELSDGEASLPVTYHGIIPDTFVDRADVVVEGELQQDGTFKAHTLLAKCPSKYESADGAEGAQTAGGVQGYPGGE